MKLFALLAAAALSLMAVDINHADLKELQSLKGIGSKTAQKIIAFREKHGCFHSIEELMKVKGVGKKTIEKNRANLEVKKCER
jgi:competence protein ComEA